MRAVIGITARTDDPEADVSSTMELHGRSGDPGGPTINEYLAAYAREGYRGSFFTRPRGALECGACHRVIPAQRVALRGMRRYEGVSDPGEMGAVAALECPECHALGTATFSIGPTSPREDGLILRALDDQRRSTRVSHESEDSSLVRDSGWLDRG